MKRKQLTLTVNGGIFLDQYTSHCNASTWRIKWSEYADGRYPKITDISCIGWNKDRTEKDKGKYRQLYIEGLI